jgi:uncharacterized protein YbbC (DUF1343 family)
VRCGLDALLGERAGDFAGRRLGLVAHPASVTSGLVHAVDAFVAHEGLNLVSVFGPQHGARGEKQDNMIESESYSDPRTGLPVHSLYGEVRKPTPEMLEGLDDLVFDLQDVGVRIYTFAWTMTLAMEACRDAGVRFVVLDRPNPVGGLQREGPSLREGFESFVGLHPIPLRHGLSLGELAQLANTEFGIGCELEVIPCEGWSRRDWFDDTGLPWVFPSPNLPTLDSCVPYPGTVLLEGTNLSEGRGTTRPFELLGAPFLDADALVERMTDFDLAGVRLRPCWFEPTFQKHAGALCGGLQVHVEDREAFRPVLFAVALFRAAMDLAPQAFAWREPPYEYEETHPPIDILWGSADLRARLAAGQGPHEILAASGAEVAAFSERVAPYLLYG